MHVVVPVVSGIDLPFHGLGYSLSSCVAAVAIPVVQGTLPEDTLPATRKKAERNAKSRARYASMKLTDKEALLAAKRVRCALSVSQPAGGPSNAHQSLSLAPVCAPVCNNRYMKLKELPVSPWFLPDQLRCMYCSAVRFHREAAGFCCASGQVCLAKTVLCPILWFLFTDETFEVAKEFRRRVRSYNNAFGFNGQFNSYLQKYHIHYKLKQFYLLASSSAPYSPKKANIYVSI